MKLLGLLLLYSLLQLNFANLTIFSPQKLVKEFELTGIKYSIGNFGRVPYGKTIIGPLHLANPITACSPLTAMQSESQTPFILAFRGNCTFVTKAHYAQLIGAKGIIIMDNLDEVSEKITMSDDGHAYALQIPSVFIEKKDGEKLANYLKSGENEQNPIFLTLKFDTLKRTHVNYTFWISPSNRKSYKMVRDFKTYYEILKDKTKFDIHYDISTCYLCALKNYTSGTPDDCLSAGRYCANDPDGLSGDSTGRDVLMENLRQICIFHHFQDQWWQYMDKFDQECVIKSSMVDCSLKIMEITNISPTVVENCIAQSFEKQGSEVNRLKDDNTLLKKERESNNGILFWPSVSINQMEYRGNLEGDEIFEAICSQFDKMPSECYSIMGMKENKGANVKVILIIVVIILGLFFLFMVFIYRRIVQKELGKEVQGKVNDMVNQYIAFYETRENKNKGENL